MKDFLLSLLLISTLSGQVLEDISLGEQGKFEVSSQPSPSHYFRLLRSRDLQTWQTVDLKSPSGSKSAILSDSVLPRPNGFYKLERISNRFPLDSDGDGRSDVDELALGHGLNPANPISILDGNIFLATEENYNSLSKRDNFPGAQNVREVKFLITNIRTNPELYFFNINQNQHHYDFAINVLNFPRNYNEFTRNTYISAVNRQNLAGSLVSHDNYIAPDGSKGIYTLEFWPTDPVAFEWIELAYEMIAKNAPFISRLAYHAPSETQRQLQRANQARYDASSIHTIETDNLFSSTTYQPMNQQEAFGRLVASTGTETLSARDIVIFKNLPNDLTYVSGIITEVPQTPLSHVNLKAQQNDTPNSYIEDAANHPEIAPLIGQNIYYRVSAEGFEIRAATQDEVEDYFESIRPTKSSSPPRDLSETKITALSGIAFSESDSFGGKAANVAELRRLFPNNAPDGFAIPFHFYHEFMIHNRFYPEVAAMISNADFKSNPALRESLLANFRDRIKNKSTMPPWMYIELTELQNNLPPNITPRLRSSANAEDTTSFNGAGLYDSFTHKEDEGHISKSVKQVWASLWNYRAYEEREFYRINHLSSAMGILVHPNQKNEQSNGVAVAKNIFDPDWEGYYFNAQAGENLVTNPEVNSTPEELLAAKFFGNSQFEIQYIRYSNQVPEGETVLTRRQVLDLVENLKVVNARFKTLYNERFNRDFAMEIEFKITESGKISIKQARPYVN